MSSGSGAAGNMVLPMDSYFCPFFSILTALFVIVFVARLKYIALLFALEDISRQVSIRMQLK